MNKKIAFIFPGQGAQLVGMGKEFYNNFSIAREVLERVDDALGYKLSNITLNGPEHDLTLTHNTQPAIMSVSVAIFSVLKSLIGLDTHLFCDIMAGHSLGEYSALCAAESITIEDTAKLLKIRGSSMQDACPLGEGAMAACLGINMINLEEIIASQRVNLEEVCDIANDNTDGQIVISGTNSYVDRVIHALKEDGYKAIKLKVSAPFHSKLVKAAEKFMLPALEKVLFKQPSVPIIQNINALKNENPIKIKENLLKQISGRVRWRETIKSLDDLGIQEIVEIGPGKVLTNMLKKTNFTFNLTNVNSIDEMKSFLMNRLY